MSRRVPHLTTAQRMRLSELDWGHVLPDCDFIDAVMASDESENMHQLVEAARKFRESAWWTQIPTGTLRGRVHLGDSTIDAETVDGEIDYPGGTL